MYVDNGTGIRPESTVCTTCTRWPERVQELEQAMREVYGSSLQLAAPAGDEVVKGGGGSLERIFVARASDTTRLDASASLYSTGRQPSPSSSAQRNASRDSSSSAPGSRSQSASLTLLFPSGTSYCVREG